MSRKILGSQIERATITKEHLSLTTPTSNSDAATKEYVDRKITFPQGLITQFRGWLDVNLDTFNITDSNKSGLFKYDPTDNTSLDDNVMTLIKDSKRFKREYSGFVDVKWFGAIADGELINNVWTGTDNTEALQNAFNFASDRGLGLLLNEGVYLISDTLKPKRVSNRSSYKLTVYGKGKGVSVLRGVGDVLIGKNLIEVDFQTGDTPGWSDSNIRMHDFTLYAGKASRCAYFNKAVFLEIDHIEFRGGDIECLKVGDGTGDNFLCYIHHNYFNTGDSKGGQNSALMNIQSLSAEIASNIGDGGYNALVCDLNQTYIVGNTFEGFKHAGVYGKSNGGGGSRIIGNTFRPYSHYDPNGVFDGEMHGIYIESVSGGAAANTISGNQLIIPTPESLNRVAIVNSIVGFISNPGGSIITGATSGATGRVVGINPVRKSLQIETLSGTFVNEVITQTGTNASASITSIVINHTYGLSLLGSAGFNTVSGNRFEGAEWSIQTKSVQNNISSNTITGVHNGILIDADTTITGNNIFLAYGDGNYIAARKLSGVVLFTANSYTGVLEGFEDIVADKLLSSKIIGTSSGSSGNLNNETNTGVISYAQFTGNAPTGYGTAFTITGNTLADPWTHQMLYGTDGSITYRHRIHSYGDWESQKVLTDRNKLINLPITSPFASAVGSGTPTQEDYNKLVDIINKIIVDNTNLINNLKASNLMNS